MESLDSRKKTFAKFAFKFSDSETLNLDSLLEYFNDGEAKGSMNVSDLWSDNSIK